MKAISAKATRAVNLGTVMVVADNSGGRLARITSVIRGKTPKGTQQYVKIADRVKISIRAGKPDMKGKVYDAVVIRLRKPYKRKTGERVCFEDNAVALLKDDKGNPQGTQIKGPVAREVQERWQTLSKNAQYVL
jgi:large subunit ribosomal protein L14